MVMKKLIAISVVFALAAGTAFAVDLGGEVIGSIVVLQGDNADGSKPTSYGVIDRLRFEGSGANDDGNFGGWIRFETPWYSDDFSFEGYGWWKPIDQFKLTLGGNSDGFIAKEGQTAWMFYQRVTDTRVTDGGNTGWGGGRYGFGLQTRNAFYGGFGAQGLLLEIRPVDMVGINLAVPFIAETGKPWAAIEPKDIFKKINAQLDFNLDFGNIALTYVGGLGLVEGVPAVAATGTKLYEVATGTTVTWTTTKPTDAELAAGTHVILRETTVGGTPGTDAVEGSKDPGTIFAYFNLTSIDNLGVDVGIGFPLPLKEEIGTVTYTYTSPISVGLGVQYASGDFGVKARAVASFAGSTKVDVSGVDPQKEPLQVLFDVLPNYKLSDNLKIFFSAGLGIVGSQTVGDTKVKDSSSLGFHVNPYVWVGQEWGPSFWAGFKLDAVKTGAADAALTWAIPIAIGVSF